MKNDLKKMADAIHQKSQSSEYRDFMISLLTEMINVRNTPDQPLSEIAAQESKVFNVLEKALTKFIDSNVSLEHAPINPAIASHPYYTNPYYTADANHPNGLPVEQVYKNRCNLFARVQPKEASMQGKPVLLNAHVDTVAPFYPASVDETYVHGRGACDDKGPVVVLAASLKLLAQIEKEFGAIPAQPRVYQFVIEEEPGGNGSLSAALDPRFKNYQAIISEATLCVPHPANRGAMWFKLELNLPADCNTAEAIAFVFAELAQLGQKLREETNQPLFPKNYIQVNLGSLDSFGKHPSAVQDYAAWELTVKSSSMSIDAITVALNEQVQMGLKRYCSCYEDRTEEIDTETQKSRLKEHYRLALIDQANGQYRFKLEFFGIGGHMSALLLCDNALIKSGYVLESLIANLQSRPEMTVDFALAEDAFDFHRLLVTGGVGFTAVHPMTELQKRMKAAVARGLERYAKTAGKSQVSSDAIRMTFDMLHNESYASPVDCPAMKAMESAYQTMNLPWPKPLAWRASCDSRIYGNNGYDTVTFGPGNLADAHSDHERIAIAELQKGLEIITLATLALITGRYEE
jgi:acetylornithine deacetylase/succinyl-diaminopimelate desuccinylase-like protein